MRVMGRIRKRLNALRSKYDASISFAPVPKFPRANWSVKFIQMFAGKLFQSGCFFFLRFCHTLTLSTIDYGLFNTLLMRILIVELIDWKLSAYI